MDSENVSLSHYLLSKDNLSTNPFTAERLYHAASLLDYYYTPFLCTVGATGNILNIFVFTINANHRNLSSSLYLTFLAASDTGFLISLFTLWIQNIGINVLTNGFMCPTVMYLGQVTCFLSVWLIVAFTVERFFAVCYPLLRPSVCTKSKARKVIFGLIALALVAFSYVLIIAQVQESVAFNRHLYGNNEKLNLTVSKPTTNGNGLDNSNMKETPNFVGESSSKLPPEQVTINTENSFTTPTSNAHTTVNPPTTFICTVPSKFHTISIVANYLDTLVTLIIPFCLISYFNIRIALSVWKLKDQRETILATQTTNVTSKHPTVVVTERLGNSRLQNSTFGSMRSDAASPSSEKWNSLKTSNDCHKKKNGESVESIDRLEISRCELLTPNSIQKTFRSVEISKISTKIVTDSTETRVTKMLLLVSTTFLVLNLPSHALRCASFLQKSILEIEDLQSLNQLQALQLLSNILLFNTNFAVNFILYCLSGSNFRKSLWQTFWTGTSARKTRRNFQFGSNSNVYSEKIHTDENIEI